MRILKYMSDPSTNMKLKARAHYDFEKARNKAFLGDIFNKLTRKNNDLFQLDEVKYLLEPHGMVYRGLKSIPINRIVGSEGRYNDFDRDFMPLQERTRARWENIELAQLNNIDLPPISVYEIDGYYFVKDGNHRVSVAKKRSQDFIDAEVIELFTKVEINEFTEKGLLVAESYKYFLDKTDFERLFPGTKLRLTNPWGYYRLVEHINTYKYLICEKAKKELPWNEAIRRWYLELYLPVIKQVRKRHIMRRFPGREPGDLYIWVMDHSAFSQGKIWRECRSG